MLTIFFWAFSATLSALMHGAVAAFGALAGLTIFLAIVASAVFVLFFCLLGELRAQS